MKIKETGLILFLENYEENARFYTDKLGLKITEKKDRLMKLEFGGSYLMVEDQGVASQIEKTREQNPTVIRIGVSDFDETIKELTNREVSIRVMTFDWGTIGVFVDPEGNRIEIKD